MTSLETDFKNSLRAGRIPVLCVRTRMCGGGTAYDVLIPKKCKRYYPIAFGHYATVVCRNGHDYFRIADALRTPEIDELPVGDERFAAYRHLEQLEKRLAIRIARKVYPELKPLRFLPSLWANWTLHSHEAVVPVALPLNPERHCGRTAREFRKDLAVWYNAQGTPAAFSTVNPYDPMGL